MLHTRKLEPIKREPHRRRAVHPLLDALPRPSRNQLHHTNDAGCKALQSSRAVEVLQQPHLEIAVPANLQYA